MAGGRVGSGLRDFKRLMVHGCLLLVYETIRHPGGLTELKASCISYVYARVSGAPETWYHPIELQRIEHVGIHVIPLCVEEQSSRHSPHLLADTGPRA